MSEEWRLIVGFPAYEVSNYGRVRSSKRGAARVLRGSRSRKTGRAHIIMYKGNKPHTRNIARLVCAAFQGQPTDGLVAAHQDGNSNNDSAENLLWKTQQGNCEDRDRHGRTYRGILHWAAQLWPNEVLDIRDFYDAAKERATEAGKPHVYGIVAPLAARYGVTLSSIEDIIYRRKWTHIVSRREVIAGLKSGRFLLSDPGEQA